MGKDVYSSGQYTTILKFCFFHLFPDDTSSLEIVVCGSGCGVAGL